MCHFWPFKSINNEECPHLGKKNVLFYQDEFTPVHFRWLIEGQSVCTSQYSPDLAPCIFFLFHKQKPLLEQDHFQKLIPLENVGNVSSRKEIMCK